MEADLTGAKLTEAMLAQARLGFANLEEANLEEANLEEANLWGANLVGADLRETRGLTQEQLEQAIGDETTKLPEGLHPAEMWSKSIEDQKKLAIERLEQQLSGDE